MTRFLLILFCVCFYACQQESTSDQTEDSQTSKPPSSSEIKKKNIEEDFEMIDASTLNQLIAEKTDSLTPKEIMRLHYTAEEEENSKITMATKRPNHDYNYVEVILIHDKLADDSVKAEKHVMALQNEAGKWRIMSLKKNWACWQGRGHTNWSTVPCN